jgi:oligopeptide/dipeptide ABC transporter ATP-binding protein
VPSPLDIPSGCRFRTRCPLAQDICAHEDPAPIAMSDTHASRCHVLPRILKPQLSVGPR